MNTKETLSLDDVETTTDVTQADTIEKVKDDSKYQFGVFIQGLYLEGARWEKKEGGKLEESEPKKLYHQMPIIHLGA